MTQRFIAIDQSTSSTKALLFDEQCKVLARTNVDHKQYYPQTGWVEHDAEEIYTNMVEAIRKLMENVDLHYSLIPHTFSLALTNQRETAVVWNKLTGKPIANAVVWQDTRGAELCRTLRSSGMAKMVFEKSGLLIDPNFSATGVKWLLDNIEGARDAANRGELLMGTIETWLIWKLTGGKTFATDYTNADGGWSWGHLASLGIPTKEGDVYTWSADVKLVGGQGFKVRSNKTTDANPVEIGDGPDQDKNFTVGGNGTYKVTVVIDAAADEKTVTIAAGEDVVIADYTNSVVGLVGAAVAEQDGAEADAGWSWGNFFSLGTPAKSGMVYTWTGTVKLQEGGCKFRSATTDADPYVEVGKDGGGDNITIAEGEEGTYVVTLIIDAEKATKTVTLVKQ